MPATERSVIGDSPPAEIRRAAFTRSGATALSLVGKRELVRAETSSVSPRVTVKAFGTSQKSCAERSAAPTVSPPTRATATAAVRVTHRRVAHEPEAVAQTIRGLFDAG